MDMQQWIGAINKAAARYSSPPLAAPISSSLGFQRPTFPLAPTKNTLEQQIEHHEAKVLWYIEKFDLLALYMHVHVHVQE
jgi:hypothetical protein